MITIQGLTATPQQAFRVPLDDGSIIDFNIRFNAAVQMWFTDLSYGEFKVFGLRICNNLNLLNQYKKIIPFGFYVQVAESSEPFLVNDLSSGRVVLNILTETEIEQLEDAYIEAQI